MNAFDLVQTLTRTEPEASGFQQLISEFSYQLGWRPSDTISNVGRSQYPGHVHLLVEHGLQNSAVLTFFPESRLAKDLQIDERRTLLALSYNNLVDWHVWIDRDHVRYVYNRTDPATEVARQEITRDDYASLGRERFEQSVGLAPNPNVPSLEDALIETISRWRRILAADLKGKATTADLSSLFNAVLLARAVEDFSPSTNPYGEALVDASDANASTSIARLFTDTIRRLSKATIPAGLIDTARLSSFDQLDRSTLRAMFQDFYRQKGNPYRFDFSVMSKHALSRIYEHYVSLLRYPDTGAQLAMVEPVPTEHLQKASGAIYTPEFIARFFARFLQRNLTPATFATARVADLACGSGIFLRTIMETQLQASVGVRQPSLPTQSARNILGVDIDENACAATRLSLSVLHLVASGKFPARLRIETGDAIEYSRAHPRLKNSLDAFVVNPPYIQIESQSEDFKRRIADFMSESGATGRLDAYLPFLIIGIDSLKPGAFGLFVLPQTFLVSESAKEVRRWVRDHAEIRCLADLSHMAVFGDVGSYVVLLIVQKLPSQSAAGNATVIRCQNFPGYALQDYLDGQRVENEHYSVFDVRQKEFARADWASIPNPREGSIDRRLAALPKLADLVDVGPGVITGKDDVFIIPNSEVPKDERDVYRPYLPSRNISAFGLPQDSGLSVFYPFRGKALLSEEELRQNYRRTWTRLSEFRSALENRSPVKRGDIKWWQLAWPRNPAKILSPKIVGPYVMLLPRFALDIEGRWIVRGGYYVSSKSDEPDLDLLKYCMALLNSSTVSWFLARQGRRYRGSYNRIEVATLKQVPIPDPSQVDASLIGRAIGLVDSLMARASADDRQILRETLDAVASEIYGWTPSEREVLG